VPISAAPPDVRELFVQRVYATLSVQLLGTMLLCWYALTYHPRQLVAILSDQVLRLVALFAPMLIVSIMSASHSARKTPPWNYALLSLFTASEALIVSLCALFVPREIVLRAGLTTAAVVGWLSLYARTTRRSFSRKAPMIASGMIFFFLLELLQLFFFRTTPLTESLYSAVGALCCAAFLVIHTQMIVGGKSQHSTLAPDEHVLASVLLYMDIIGMFIRLMNIMSGEGSGRRRRRDDSDGNSNSGGSAGWERAEGSYL
jgi:FtsH-binding integral membrane protein